MEVDGAEGPCRQKGSRSTVTMTYRERREAKAERLRGWADSREAKAEAARTGASAIADMIPFGQPILVGHHSEGRHRRDLDTIAKRMDATVEHSRKAADMRSRAANIEAAADHAIYSDDPDAIERLTEKLAGLEAKRDKVKKANAEYRKAHRTELKAMTAYQRGQAVPFPAYVLTNLSGTISTTRKRLDQLKRDSEAPTAKVRHGRRGCYVKCSAGCQFDYMVNFTFDQALAIATAHNTEEHGSES